ncbi:30S ribosomal protein S17 [Candidatus Saccharibacteria bacterium]|nr:30S ribosomal protein S17 [Candidatus Saccharibacteria bacterium]
MAKSMTGVVVSDKTDKTIVVSVQTHKTHPLYRKAYVTSKKFMAHDEQNEAHLGDKVIITETRPLSARKRHALQTIVERSAITAKDSVEAITANQTKAAVKPTENKSTKDKQPENKDSSANEASAPEAKSKKEGKV